MAEQNPDDRPNRRSFLKGVTASTAMAAGFSGIAAADGCDPVDLKVPDDTDFTVYLWRTQDADDEMSGKISMSEIRDYLDTQYSKVSSFDVTFRNGAIMDSSTFKEETSADEDHPMWPFGDWIQDQYYGGDWQGEQGRIDVLYYDAANWTNGDRNNGEVPSSGGAYNGAHSNSRRNPAPIAMVRTDNANDVGLKCRAKHELCHLFMPEGPDDYGYAQNDHKVMDLGADEVETQCLPLNDWSVKFIEDAYDYGWVDPSAPDSVYDCQP